MFHPLDPLIHAEADRNDHHATLHFTILDDTTRIFCQNEQLYCGSPDGTQTSVIRKNRHQEQSGSCSFT